MKTDSTLLTMFVMALSYVSFNLNDNPTKSLY